MQQSRLSVLFLYTFFFTVVSMSAQTEVVLDVQSSAFAFEISWELIHDGSATVIASRACASYAGWESSSDTMILINGDTYTLNCYDDYGDGWGGSTFSLWKTSDGCVIAGGSPDNLTPGDFWSVCTGLDLELSFNFDPAGIITGCTDPLSDNYNPCAVIDDGGCFAYNNACADAIEIPVGTCYTGTNHGASNSPDYIPVYSCPDGDTYPSDIWFWTTVPPTGSLTISHPVVPGISSIIELYQTDCDGVGPANDILGNAGICDLYKAGDSVSLTGLTPGHKLYIQYWDYDNNDLGDLEICVKEYAAGGCTNVCAINYDPSVPYDDGSCIIPTDADYCGWATSVEAGSHSFTTTGATGSDVSSCTNQDSLDVWFAYDVLVGMDTLTIRTCGSNFDTGLSLWDHCIGSEIACNDDGALDGYTSCGGSLFQSMIQLTGPALASVAGTTIYIRVSGFAGQSGCGELIIEEAGSGICLTTTPPQNVTHDDDITSFALEWTAVPNSVGCQIQATKISPPGPTVTAIVSGFEVNEKIVPAALLGSGTIWTWMVRCACQTTPFPIATAFSEQDTLVVSAAREPMKVYKTSIYPNPADQSINLHYDAVNTVSNLEIIIWNMLGQEIIRSTHNIKEGFNELIFNVSGFDQGVYFIQIGSNSSIEVLPFHVAR